MGVPSEPALTAGFQQSPPWGLDRIDGRGQSSRLNGNYTFGLADGAGASVYLLDSNINTAHVEFRQSRAFDNSVKCAIQDERVTHAASVVAGLRCGVAKAARVISVQAPAHAQIVFAHRGVEQPRRESCRYPRLPATGV